jgi:cytidylate kinase
MTQHLEELVNRQVKQWEKAQAGPPLGEDTIRRGLHKPMICISREYGGRGAAVGRLVAEKLNFDFFSRELVEEVAKHAHMRKQIVESLDEKTRNLMFEWVVQQFGNESFTNTEYLRHLSHVVRTLSKYGRGVLVGRGAQFILSSASTLRIRTIASLDIRIDRIAKREGTSRSEARAEVLKTDAEREGFCRQHFNLDIADAKNYDLVLNTGTIAEEACAQIIVDQFQARFSG